MHYGAISLDRAFDYIIIIFEIDDDNIWTGKIAWVVLADTHEMIRFECLVKVREDDIH